ncbi:MAG TPA: ankyrin repeat domain-containing protein, partial [Methylomirabilota bacterium]|nr:ankyrin repeat domain-containing protein [Methylomirabilota bacterium]
AAVNATNEAGATALMRAATDFDKTRLLVERGADVNVRSRMGNTALLLAARPADSHRTVELLLAHGADAKATNNAGATALMAAAAGGDLSSARLLLKHGAEVNALPTPDEQGFLFGGGRSALMWAAFRGNVAMLRLLVEAGANVNAVTGLGTALAQAAWADRLNAARFLLERGARIDQAGPVDDYTALHWAASSEERDPRLVKLLLERGADPNRPGGRNVDAFLGIPQTPLMLASRRGETPLVSLLVSRGATNTMPDRASSKAPPPRTLSDPLNAAALREAMANAVPPLQATALRSKESFLRHASRQDCTSCHQQYLPMAAVARAGQNGIRFDAESQQRLIALVGEGEIRDPEVDWQALFHPDAAFTKGYELFGYAVAKLPPDGATRRWVHHLAAIQGPEGQWYNNLPRPPLQTGDIGATALAVYGLQNYPLAGRKVEFATRVDRARRWLWKTRPRNNEGRIYQLLGLAWAGEPAAKLQPLAQALVAEQRADGGWAQVPDLNSDAYATAQAVYALRTAGRLELSEPAVERGVRFLLQTQLSDGTWHVRRRAFPFQPTMDSGFPHGRDAWISAAATSWAVLALSH